MDRSALPLALKAGWGVGALGAAVLLNGISALALFYMVSILGLEPALAGGLMFATKLFDMATDPLVGAWSDRANTPLGRRRPFLGLGAIVSAMAFAGLFATPPLGSTTALAAWVTAMLLLYTVGYTLFNVPYLAMPAEMTDNYHERSSIHAWRIVFISIGAFLAAAAAPAFLEVMGRDSRASYGWMGAIGGLLIFASMGTAFFATARARTTTRGPAAVPLVSDARALLANRHFLRLLGVKCLQLLGVFATQAALIFFIANELQRPLTALSLFGAAATLSTIAAAPLLVRLSRRFGKREAWMVAGAAYVVYSLSWVLAVPGEPLWALALRGLVVGVAASGNVILAMSMLTDIIEWDVRRTGVRREGTYTALYSLVEKAMAALGPLVVGVALSVAGLGEAAGADGASRQALLVGIAYLPAVLGLAALALLAGYRLDEARLRALA